MEDLKNMSDEELIKAYKHAKYMENQKNTEQLIEKVIINSLYGALANKYFKLFNVEIARAITGNTRFYLHLLNYRINEFLKEKTGKDKRFVLTNDTDSGYFELNDIVEKYYNGPDDVIKKTEFLDEWIKKELDPIIEKINKEFGEILNAFNPNVIKAEREVIADTGIYIAKKKYILRVYDNEGVKYTKDNPYIKITGVEIIKSSTPIFVQKYLKESINIILDKNQNELIEWLDSVKQKFIEQPLADIAKVSSVSSLDYDIRTSKSIPINSRAAIATNEYIQKSEELSKRFTQISAGDKIKLLYLKMPNPIGQNVFAFIDPAFAELFREYIDFDLCWDKYFMKPLNIMIAPLGWNIEKRTEALDEW